MQWNMRIQDFAILIPLVAVGAVTAQSDLQSQCSHLSTLVSAHIRNVQSPRSAFIDVHGMNVSGIWNSVPFCRFQGLIPYPDNNSVLFEIWLPDNETYNGRYLSVGAFPFWTIGGLLTC